MTRDRAAEIRASAREDAVARHRRAVHLVDGEVIYRALLGTPVALTEIEQGAVITICDTHGLDRQLTAAGLGVTKSHLEQQIVRRRQRVTAAAAGALVASMQGPAWDLVEAVAARDRGAVAAVFDGLGPVRLEALAIVLADLLAGAERGSL